MSFAKLAIIIYFFIVACVIVWLYFYLADKDERTRLIVAEPTQSVLYQDKAGTTFRCREWERQ